MIALRVGVDAVEVDRFADLVRRHGDAFLERHFTDAERTTCAGAVQRLAARFAAKEAVGKALRTGVPGTLSRDIEVVTLDSGAPSLRLHGRARDEAAALGIATWDVSLTHTERTAIAMVAGVCASEDTPET